MDKILMKMNECKLCDGTGMLEIVRQLTDGSCEPDVIPGDCFLDIHGIEDSTGDDE